MEIGMSLFTAAGQRFMLPDYGAGIPLSTVVSVAGPKGRIYQPRFEVSSSNGAPSHWAPKSRLRCDVPDRRSIAQKLHSPTSESARPHLPLLLVVQRLTDFRAGGQFSEALEVTVGSLAAKGGWTLSRYSIQARSNKTKEPRATLATRGSCKPILE